jgi:nitroreductase
MEDAPALPADSVGLLDGLVTTRAIRRYRDEPVPAEALRTMLFAATRAPSGSNRQPFRFLVLTDSPRAVEAKRLIGSEAKRLWAVKGGHDGYYSGSGQEPESPKTRMARTMADYVNNFDKVPVLVLACLVRYRAAFDQEGASVYPACQNLLLAARAIGYGGVMTIWHAGVESSLRRLLEIPDDVVLSATISIGRPEGSHGPVRRRPMSELVFGDGWETAVAWAVDPPGTRFTSAGPPRRAGPAGKAPKA